MFKVGDKVKIVGEPFIEGLEWFECNKGKVVTIKSIDGSDVRVRQNCYSWHPDWLQFVSSENIGRKAMRIIKSEMDKWLKELERRGY